MARPKTALRDQERPFYINELFFSTTTRAGVILSGNDVFRRVAGFDSVKDLIGKPHNVIRHPDMPRAVFRLFWDYLEAGKSVGAYVKNLATDGAYYWVFALAVPIEGGFLSVRFKPSSVYFPVVIDLYREILQIEAESGNKPGVRDVAMRKAGERLIEALQEKGFADYDQFMRTALATEMSSRAQLMASKGYSNTFDAGDSELADTLSLCRDIELMLDTMFVRIGSFLELIECLESKSNFLKNLSEQINLLSLNSLIASHRLGYEGKGLTVVADNLATISGESTNVITEMTVGIHAVVTALRDLAFRISGAKLQVGIAITFVKELIQSSSQDSEDAERERNDLKTLSGSFSRGATEIGEALPRMREPLDALFTQLHDLARMIKALTSVHVIGRVEAAQLDGASAFLQLFDEVHNQLAVSKSELLEFSMAIDTLCTRLPEFDRDSGALLESLGNFGTPAA